MVWIDIFAAIRWFLVIRLIGTVALPLTTRVFWRLRGRGYAFADLLGLLLTGFVFWLAGSLGITANSLGGVLVALLAVAAVSVWAGGGLSLLRDSEKPFFSRLRRFFFGDQAVDWLYVALVNVVYMALFALWVYVRAHNPMIANTEKPMEIAFLNALGRAPSFPPHDPWLSGFAISYYYFGFLLASMVARLAAVAEPVAFNLNIAWLVAAGGVGALGLVYNLVAEQMRRAALVLGLAASLALPLAGNLEIVLELAHANGIGSAEFWQWLDVRDLKEPPHDDGFATTRSNRYWWWWRSSRVINERTFGLEETLEPIAEYPAFSFVLGDMHPHVMALPFAFLSFGLALTWFLDESTAVATDLAALARKKWRRLLLTAILIGGIAFLNTWDVLTHLFVMLAAFMLARWRGQGWHKRRLTEAAGFGAGILVGAYLLYLPFFVSFSSQAGAPYLLPMLVAPTRLPHFLIIFGMPLWVLGWLMAVLMVKQKGKGLGRAFSLLAAFITTLLVLATLLGIIIAGSPDGANRILQISSDLGRSLTLPPDGTTPLWALKTVFLLMPAVIATKFGNPWVVLLLAALLASSIAFVSRRYDGKMDAPDSAPTYLPFILLLIVTGGLLTLGPEFVYLKDGFGVRMNTIFKFYYQAWLLFGVAALAALPILWQKSRAIGAVVALGYVALLAGALVFPLQGAPSRWTEYGGKPTLDGIAYRNAGELAAIHWLRDEVEGTPVILEATGGQYSDAGRMAANSGLPTVVGWVGHELQWRGAIPEPGLRQDAVDEIYNGLDWGAVSELLDLYEVRYVVVGSAERSKYGPEALQKFADHLQIAYENEGIMIYGR